MPDNGPPAKGTGDGAGSGLISAMPGAGVYVARLIGAVKEAVDGKYGVESVSADEDFWVAAPALVPRHIWERGLRDAAEDEGEWYTPDYTEADYEKDLKRDGPIEVESQYRSVWEDDAFFDRDPLEKRNWWMSGLTPRADTSDPEGSHTEDTDPTPSPPHKHPKHKPKGAATRHGILTWLLGRAPPPPPPPPPKNEPNPNPKGMNTTLHQTKAPWHLTYLSSNVTVKGTGTYHYNATEGRGGMLDPCLLCT